MGKSRLKVAMVSQSMNIGGGEMMAAKLAGYVNPEEYEVKLFIIGHKQDNQMKDILEESQVNYECLGLPTSFDFRSFRIFKRALDSFNPDVVHEHLDVCYSWVWTFLKNKPLIATMHSDPYRRKNKKVNLIIRLKSHQGNLRVIGVSKKTSELVKRCYGLPEGQISHIYNPIDTSEYQTSYHNFEKIRFVHVGRFNPIKNHNMLIEAFHDASTHNENIELYLAGDGQLLEEIKDKVDSLDLTDKIHFLGNVDNIPNLLKNMDVLVLSSISEACPMVILEAMSAGLPIIATTVGGVPELIDGNGILVDNKDTHGFSSSIQRLAANRKQIMAYASISIKNSKRYDKGVIVEKYQQEYLKLRENYDEKFRQS